jgi:hypothetical protein
MTDILTAKYSDPLEATKLASKPKAIRNYLHWFHPLNAPAAGDSRPMAHEHNATVKSESDRELARLEQSFLIIRTIRHRNPKSLPMQR